MDGLCSLIAKKLSNEVCSNTFQIGSTIFSTITRLKLYDQVISRNDHVLQYGLDTIERYTSISLEKEEFCEIIGYYKEKNLKDSIEFRGEHLDIPKILATDKIRCEVCDSQLTFYNDRQPYISSLYDLKDGTSTVNIYIYIYIRLLDIPYYINVTRKQNYL